MRKAFSDTLLAIADADPRLAFITGDLGFQVFDEFKARHGGRYVNAGVAEAQMIGAAAGMAAEGYRPVAYSIASFATARPFEQIRYCVAYPKLPVVLVGAGRGLTYANAGVSHHAMDDIALMSAIPGMTVVIPGDPGEIEQLLPQVVAQGAPAYFTVGRFGEPRYEAEEPAVLGRARLLRRGAIGQGVAIACVGEVAGEVLAAHAALRADGIEATVYQFHTVKPLDTAVLDRLATEVEHLLVVEEHSPQGGLFSAIAGWAATADRHPRLHRLGAPDAFALGNLTREGYRREFGFDAGAIAGRCRAILH